MQGGRSAQSLWGALVLGVAVSVVLVVPVLPPSTSVAVSESGIGVQFPGQARPRSGDRPALDPQRSTGPAVGAVTASIDDLARHTGALVPVGGSAVDPVCPWDQADRALAGAERHQRIVEFAYCSLLDRGPEPDGIAYWRQQLGEGLDVVDLVVQITGSSEYRNRRPGRARWEESPFGALMALEPATGNGPGSEVAGTVPPITPPTTRTTQPPTGSGDAGLRVRQPLTVGEFDRWVADRAIAEVDRVTGALVHGRISGDGQSVNVVYVHRSVTRNLRVSPGNRGRATVGSWAREIGADVAINGNWYAPWDGPAVSGGQVYAGSDHGYTALFGVTVEGDVVVEHHRAINGEVDQRIIDGVSGHPTLVHRGRRTTDFGTDPTFLNRHPRTAIGLDATGDILILVTVDGRSTRARGMTGDETARLMERLGAHDGLMLDGGGSTTMWIAGRGVVNRPSGPLRAVGNQLAAYGS